MLELQRIMLEPQRIMVKAPRIMVKAPRIMRKAPNKMPFDHLRQLWLSIITSHLFNPVRNRLNTWLYKYISLHFVRVRDILYIIHKSPQTQHYSMSFYKHFKVSIDISAVCSSIVGWNFEDTIKIEVDTNIVNI